MCTEYRCSSSWLTLTHADTLKVHQTYHTVYLWLASLCQVYDIDPVVVKVFHAAVEVLPQKGAGFTRQRDAPKTQLYGDKETQEVNHLSLDTEIDPTRTGTNMHIHVCYVYTNNFNFHFNSVLYLTVEPSSGSVDACLKIHEAHTLILTSFCINSWASDSASEKTTPTHWIQTQYTLQWLHEHSMWASGLQLFMVWCLSFCQTKGNLDAAAVWERPFVFIVWQYPCAESIIHKHFLLCFWFCWRDLAGLHRTLTPALSNASGVNWNTSCEPGLIAHHQCPPSLMLLWLNGSKSPQQGSKIFLKAFPEEWRLLSQHKNGHGFGMTLFCHCLGLGCPQTFSHGQQ